MSTPLGRKETPFNSLPVYGLSYRLAVEVTDFAARLVRNYRYSIGEDLRQGVKKGQVSPIGARVSLIIRPLPLPVGK